MGRARAGALCALASLLPVAWSTGQPTTPLLDYATGLRFDTSPNEELYRRHALTVSSQLARDPPPTSDCSRMLGAARFAGLFHDLAAARSALGDERGAIEAYEGALGCNPRALHLHAGLAEELLHEGRRADARAAAERGLAIDPADYRAGSVLARIDFIEERWPQAIERLRSIVAATADPERASWECFLWLAQLRSGMERPELLERSLTDEWPDPILATLRSELSEQQLLEAIEAQASERRRREMLVEALYYLGERRLAAGEAAVARSYFAAAVNLKVLYFIEHHMARAELANMREM
jgi:tetratricopeptide (TPR) repeat protein